MFYCTATITLATSPLLRPKSCWPTSLQILITHFHKVLANNPQHIPINFPIAQRSSVQGMEWNMVSVFAQERNKHKRGRERTKIIISM